MNNVTDISAHKDYREMVTKTLWYCTECESEEFRLTTDGCVYCVGCRNRISDLHTVKDDNDGSDT